MNRNASKQNPLTAVGHLGRTRLFVMSFVPKGKIDISDLKMILLPLKAFILLEQLETLRYAVLKVGI